MDRGLPHSEECRITSFLERSGETPWLPPHTSFPPFLFSASLSDSSPPQSSPTSSASERSVCLRSFGTIQEQHDTHPVGRKQERSQSVTASFQVINVSRVRSQGPAGQRCSCHSAGHSELNITRRQTVTVGISLDRRPRRCVF